MIRIDFDPTSLTGEDAEWWSDWEQRAAAATADLRRRTEAEEEEKPSFDSRIWRDLKEWLFRNVFHKRCAYCEREVMSTSFGAGEHWRPKGEVTERREGKLEAIKRDGKPHPGYWWLAYEWTNLLPSCDRCNTSSKKSQFPVRKEHVFAPVDGEGVAELDVREEPLLLHPFKGEDPADHLDFDEVGGVRAAGNSPYGRASIDVLQLNRSDLVESRHERLEDVASKVELLAIGVVQGGRSFDEVAGEDPFRGKDFSAAARQCAARVREAIRDRM